MTIDQLVNFCLIIDTTFIGGFVLLFIIAAVFDRIYRYRHRNDPSNRPEVQVLDYVKYRPGVDTQAEIDKIVKIIS